jgi:hypothetical protein
LREKNPINAICDEAMRVFADLAQAASADSRYARARAKLGRERVADVAVAALRAALKRLLTEDAADVLAELEVAGLGHPAAAGRILGVADEAIQAVIQAAEEAT